MAILSISTMTAVGVRAQFSYSAFLNSAKNAYNKAFIGLLRTFMQFFDATPVGRIINRMSRDVFLIDEMLTLMYADLVHMVFTACGFIVVMLVTVPYFLVFVTLLAVAFFSLRKYVLFVARELRRIEIVTRSPLFTYISSAMDGLIIIRNYDSCDRFKGKMIQAADLNLKAFFNF